ncbi:MAG: N-acetyltransferase, partial [Bacteroidales bacterium]|nr:N-acetyltransferase [Bacteroidales bacterium]
MRYIVREVASSREFKQFYQFQNRLYKDCATYVPSLDFDQKHTLSKSPCLDYCRQKLLLCFNEEGQVVGRCCAIINPRYNELYGTRRMRFGWTDFIEDFEVARLLLSEAEAWGRSQGMNEIHGPLGYNTMYKQGLVVEGFDS